MHALCTPEATVHDDGGGFRGQEEMGERGRRGTGNAGDMGSEEEKGHGRDRGTTGPRGAVHEMVEHFVGLEMTVIHQLEVQDKKMEKFVAELIGEAQRSRTQGERIIALLEAEDSSEDEEGDAEVEDDQAVVVAVTGGKGEDDDDEDEDAEETETLK
jgi:hypothetical protein